MTDSIDLIEAQCKIERARQWRDWCNMIPFISFPADWEVQMMPPFGGALVRFRAQKGEKQVSVYLDGYDTLGYFGEPYWEAFPINDDTARFAMKDTDELLSIIGDELG